MAAWCRHTTQEAIMARVNSDQSYVIVNKTKNRIIGTDSRIPFTRTAAEQKVAVLTEYSDDELEIVQLVPIFMAIQ
jgi:hypothetical protein